MSTDPSTVLSMIDDFIIGGYSAARGRIESQYTYAIQASGTGTPVMPSATIAQDGNHPGIVEFTTGAGTDGASGIYGAGPSSGAHNLYLFLGAGAVTFECLFNIPTLSTAADEYRIKVGLGRTMSNAGDTNGAFLTYYRPTSVNWRTNTIKASTATAATSNSAVATGWTKLRIEANAAGTSVEFFINDVSIGVHTENIPTLGIGLIFSIDKLGGTTGTTPRLTGLDYWRTQQTFTTAR